LIAIHEVVWCADDATSTLNNDPNASNKYYKESKNISCNEITMNGIQATKALRERGVKTPVYALTANAMKQDVNNCIQAGMVCLHSSHSFMRVSAS
jgi:CheY-like chemotaxis protein